MTFCLNRKAWLLHKVLFSAQTRQASHLGNVLEWLFCICMGGGYYECYANSAIFSELENGSEGWSEKKKKKNSTLEKLGCIKFWNIGWAKTLTKYLAHYSFDFKCFLSKQVIKFDGVVAKWWCWLVFLFICIYIK